MSLLKSMNTGLSGLAANGRAMSLIGDNIANVNTMGFKRSRINFSDVIGNTMLGVGDGVRGDNVQQLFEQGALELTGSSTDMAITGNGFFVVSGEVGGEQSDYFTRSGQFMIDTDGFVVTPAGLRLQGYQMDADGNLTSQVGDIQLGGLSSNPSPTSAIEVELNLDPQEEILTDPWDPADPVATSNYSTSVTMYDSQGREIEAQVYYRKTAENEWEYHVMVDGEDQQGGTAGTAEEIGTGTLSFDTDGNLTTHTPGATNFNPPGATQPQPLEFEFEGSTQFAGESTMRRMSQDGYAPGEIRDVRIEPDGTIVGIFSNGEDQTLGRVALADFEAPHELERLGSNVWRATSASGQAALGAPGSGGRGSIVQSALEGSNVDLAHEFVKMIAAQRGYQANSRTITTGDQMLQEVMSLKR